MSDVVKAGLEFRVNNFTLGNQLSSDVTMLLDGRYVITWKLPSLDGLGDKLSGHYYSNTGQALGSEFTIRSSYEGETRNKITVLSDGKFLVSWLDSDLETNVAQVYDQALNNAGNVINLNLDGSGPSFTNYTAALPNGGFAYYSLGSFAWPIPHLLGETFTANGALTGTFGPGDGRTHLSPTLAVLNDGSFVYAWFAGPIRFASEQPPDAIETSFGWSRIGASEPTLAKMFDGGFILTWVENSQTFGQRFDKTATEIGPEFAVKSGSTTGLVDNSFIVTWEADDGSGLGIYGQRYSQVGTAIGSEFRINSFTGGDQSDASVAASADGSFIVSWTSAAQDGSGTGVYAQRFDLSSVPEQPPSSGKPVTWIVGSGANEALEGDARNNSLNGGGGRDTTIGGLGDDTYGVEGQGDTVIELAGQGIDTVESWGSYVLSANVENLKLLGINLTGTGNELANAITGGKGVDLLNGKAGNDYLTGGAGADTFVFERGTGHDVITDFAAGSSGTDVVKLTDFGFTSFAQIQTALVQVGGDAQLKLADGTYVSFLNHLTSDFLAEDFGFATPLAPVGVPLPSAPPASAKPGSYITRGAGDDTFGGDKFANYLNGGGGRDTTSGSAGDDTYGLEGQGDTVIELAGEGIDTIESYGSYVLSTNVENLKLLGINLTGTGNELANAITGGKGVDLLNGKAGNDYLTGGAGADTFVFERGTGHDVITDFAAGSTGTDVVSLHAFSYSSFAQIQAAMVQADENVQLKLQDGSYVSFLKTTVSQFDAGDFML